jgi:hypothetical protein
MSGYLHPRGLFIYLSMALKPFFNLGRFFSFFVFLNSRQDSLDGGSAVARPVPAYRTPQT